MEGGNLSPAGGGLVRSLLVKAAYSVVPKSKRTRRYVDQYSCCPPPVFMVLVSVVEVRAGAGMGHAVGEMEVTYMMMCISGSGLKAQICVRA